MTKEERTMQRSALIVRYHQYESEFRQRIDLLKQIVRTDPMSGGRNYTQREIDDWILQAERFSAAMDQIQSQLFTDTHAFLTAAAAAMPT